jgi:hypothetical protein
MSCRLSDRCRSRDPERCSDSDFGNLNEFGQLCNVGETVLTQIPPPRRIRRTTHAPYCLAPRHSTCGTNRTSRSFYLIVGTRSRPVTESGGRVGAAAGNDCVDRQD